MEFNDISTTLSRIKKHAHAGEALLKAIHSLLVENSPQFDCDVPAFDKKGFKVTILGITALIRPEIKAKHAGENKPADITSAIFAYAIFEKDGNENLVSLTKKDFVVSVPYGPKQDGFEVDFVKNLFDGFFKQNEIVFIL